MQRCEMDFVGMAPVGSYVKGASLRWRHWSCALPPDGSISAVRSSTRSSSPILFFWPRRPHCGFVASPPRLILWQPFQSHRRVAHFRAIAERAEEDFFPAPVSEAGYISHCTVLLLGLFPCRGLIFTNVMQF